MIIAALALSVIAIGAIIVSFRRLPHCPECGSHNIDEYPSHGICRLCGKRWEEPRRFGSHGGSDL